MLILYLSDMKSLLKKNRSVLQFISVNILLWTFLDCESNETIPEKQFSSCFTHSQFYKVSMDLD